MPPNLDIYVISHAQDRETIEHFLSAYVDRAASEDRGDEELMMLAWIRPVSRRVAMIGTGNPPRAWPTLWSAGYSSHDVPSLLN
jgi:hypothetical protein